MNSETPSFAWEHPGQRMLLQVRSGKGAADRYTLLSPSLLTLLLRAHGVHYRCHKRAPGWLFAHRMAEKGF